MAVMPGMSDCLYSVLVAAARTNQVVSVGWEVVVLVGCYPVAEGLFGANRGAGRIHLPALDNQKGGEAFGGIRWFR